MWILSFFSSCCTVERLERCSNSRETIRKPSMVPLLDGRPENCQNSARVKTSFFIKVHRRPTVCLDTSNILDYSNDLESVRAKLRKVNFDEAIDLGFTNDIESTRVKTIRFTLTPNNIRN
ncbi:hypothetical protein K7432_010708 [Basidiobolus ranarum]|uniref:Uncharacterized protein n=1 Tax=Basidiobolus ranarum TaxID=34480 RepID=A0ABR2VVH9_9FUNG